MGIAGHLVNMQYLFLAGNQALHVCISPYFELQGLLISTSPMSMLYPSEKFVSVISNYQSTD
jgi:hypothetical protein